MARKASRVRSARVATAKSSIRDKREEGEEEEEDAEDAEEGGWKTPSTNSGLEGWQEERINLDETDSRYFPRFHHL